MGLGKLWVINLDLVGECCGVGCSVSWLGIHGGRSISTDLSLSELLSSKPWTYPGGEVSSVSLQLPPRQTEHRLFGTMP
jgi:hypothetical protein